MVDPRDVERALSYIDSSERESWIRMGLSVKSGLGEEGRDLWMAWSATSAKFNGTLAARTWDGFKPSKLTIGTLFAAAKALGFQFEKRERGEDYYRRRREQAARNRAAQQKTEQQRQSRAAAAAREAQAMLERATLDEHPYLAAKRLPIKALVLDGLLLVPMRNVRTREIMAVQQIDSAGAKKYQPWGCDPAACVHVIGPRRPRATWYCEGYGTGLSVRAALQAVSHEQDSVCVCFSAGQLPKVARGRRGEIHIVVADCDWWHCQNGHRWGEPHDACPECGKKLIEPAGEVAARATGLPWWMPERSGQDASDVFVERGARALGQELLEIRRLAALPLRGRAA